MYDPVEPHSLPRREDARFLTGRGRFTADLACEGVLHAALLRSEYAHAEILAVDYADALGVPGVVAVHVAADLDADGLQPLPCVTGLTREALPAIPPRHALARGRVRHVGEPVALVLADDPGAALEAVERVRVEYRELPAVADARRALAPGAPELWPEAPGNLAFRFEAGDRAATQAAFREAAHVVALDIANPRASAVPLEPRAGLATFDPATGRFTLTATAQGLHEIRAQAAGPVFGLPEDRFHLLAPDVGGGFGLKNFLYPEWILLPWAARRHRRPVRWVATRGEDLAAAAHGRDVHARARLALAADGTFLALEARLVANMGAYLSGGAPNVTTKALPTAMGGIYAIPEVYLESRGVFTNTAPVDAYRGAGKPEANFIIERLIDAAARRGGFDPVALRTRNALSRFPHRTALGITIDGGRFAAGIERAVALADRDGFEARRAHSAARGQLRGLGLGCFLETARGFPREGAGIRFPGDGTAEIRVGTESHGQGHETAFAQIASARLGLPVEAFRFVQADTDRVPMGHGHGGARSMHMGGGALVAAIEAVLAKAHPIAARLLQADPSQIEFAAGVFSVPASGREVGLLQVAAAAREMAGIAHAVDGAARPGAGDPAAKTGIASGARAPGAGEGAPRPTGNGERGGADGGARSLDDDGEPARPDGEGEPAGPDGEGQPVGPDGDGEPAGPDGDGEPAGLDGDGEPAGPDGDGEPAGLDAFATVEDAPFTFPNGCHVAEVEIDPETGGVRLLRYLCVDDYGALVNPRLTAGQVHGGVAQGIGQALAEEVVYDPASAQLLSGSLMDYGLPAATLLPDLEVHLEGEPTRANPLGVKGAGQAGAIAAPQAVMNAVIDALAPLGIDHLDMPASSERIWRAIRDASA